MKLTIITISYNSSENTIDLLESLKNQTDKDFEVIVVDNNSDDVEKLMEYKTTETNPAQSNSADHQQKGQTLSGASIIYIKNDLNLGFSGGNNVGIKKAVQNGSDWMLLLNNDTMPENHLIEHLRAKIGGKEGIIGLALDEGKRTAFGGLVQWLKPTLRHIYHQTDMGNSEVYAIGGAMLIHKSVFDKIGFLDENYFLYFEDADFCQRARKVKIPISFYYDSLIYHSVSASTKKLGSPMLLRYHYRNSLYFNLKNGPWYIKLLIWPWSVFVILKQILKTFLNIKKDESVAILKGVIDWYTGKMGKIKNGY